MQNLNASTDDPRSRNTQIISMVKKNAILGEKGLDTIAPIW